MTSVWHCKNFWKTEPLRQAKPCHWQQRWCVLYNIIINNLIRTWPDNTRSRVDVCALMAPRLRINGYPRIQQLMELFIVAQGDSVNTLGMYIWNMNQLVFLQWQGCLHMLGSREQSLPFPTNSSAQSIKHFVSHLIMIVLDSIQPIK